MTQIEQKTKGYIWLILGAVCCAFAGGKYNLAFLSWFFPLFYLRFLHYRNRKTALIPIYLLTTAAYLIKFDGLLLNVSTLGNLLFLAMIALITTIPFLVESFIMNKGFNRYLSLLILPLCWTLLDYIVSLKYLGTTFSIAVTQYDFLSFIQVVSITGFCGVTFIMILTASIVNDAWEHRSVREDVKKEMTVICLILAAVLFFGGIRLAMHPLTSETLRVASVQLNYNSDSFAGDSDSLLDDAYLADEVAGMEEDIKVSAGANADVIQWYEESFVMSEANEQCFVDSACALAKKYKTPLLVPVEINREDALNTNKELFINAQGEVEWSYTKVNLVPIVETDDYETGENGLSYSDVKGTKISGAICFDSNYPTFINQAGRNGADLLLIPAWEWKDIGTYNSYGTALRCIENGFSQVRNAYEGVIVANDPCGRILTDYQSLDTSERVIFSEVPLRGIRTVYSYFGDWFPIGCAVALVIVTGRLVFLKRKDGTAR
jgi:apolipoprotein N-acyltransferase